MTLSPAPRPAPPATLARLRQLYLLGLGALALPAAVIGVPLGYLLRPQWPNWVTGLLVGIAASCSLVALATALRWARAAQQPEGKLSAAPLLASGCAVPLLMCGVLWRAPLALGWLLGLALLGFLAGWWLLLRWAAPEPTAA